jgi:peptide deformylase
MRLARLGLWGGEGQVVEEAEEREAEREFRRRYVLANVRQYPDPVLRMKTNDVTAFGDALAALVERMMRVMQSAKELVRRAAVGVLQRVLVHHADEEADLARARQPAHRRDLVGERGWRRAASLDAAGVVVEVERPLSVTVDARTPAGEELRFDAEGLEARVIQHEVDHLDGVLIIDRTTPEQRRAALGRLRPQPILGG